MSSIFSGFNSLFFQLLLSLSSLLLYIKIGFSIQYILRFQYLISFSNFPPSSTLSISHFFFFFFSFQGEGQPLDLKLEGRRDRWSASFAAWPQPFEHGTGKGKSGDQWFSYEYGLTSGRDVSRLMLICSISIRFCFPLLVTFTDV